MNIKSALYRHDWEALSSFTIHARKSLIACLKCRSRYTSGILYFSFL
ncbi:hypothetical protein XNW1_450004 [Xenorhabdus nematophila str. Websteri]|nr:hypothetical protein XNA1_4640005 [Xenorhabdus nematophila str. Anatoliense]CEE95630.1 hypothetical protein XNA1_600005 [Xenorhabdus nematophila str. Anatoliense]CEF29932.1 hypothetical protein XNW1_2110004 [Xenorhabdus nematophila str. Websteri]CEF32742.1 hypothetical protein XNW1_450004 [Xenorhabdus nematophila str. Websteri]